MGRDLPRGPVTFLFTDVEGSTSLLHRLGPEAYAADLAEHRRILRTACNDHGGIEVDTQGDAFFFVFPSALSAVEAAGSGQEELSRTPIRVRMGLHTGTPHLTEEGYVGPDVHKAARIAAAGYGGQVLLSRETKELIDLEVTDLGEHRLKDFTEPVWIFQLGKDGFPPLRTISNTNLPQPASSFIGREREIEAIVSTFRQGARLVTLTGPGGTGKTRLSIAVGAELAPSNPNGVFWVPLAALRDAGLVVEEISRTLGAGDDLAAYIGERKMLLILDNFEQVMPAAPALSSVLGACPRLSMIVTSRELLRIQGEVGFPVPPLTEEEAVRLFNTRAGASSEPEIAEICARLDNLPLAVELAAARAKVMTPSQILQRLSKRLDILKGGRDADPRQATLRATIEWSHDLLGEEEKKLFSRLAVFSGGCTLGSAEAVIDADIDLLQSLVDKSLLRRTEDRFWMLETVREYAIERLDASGEVDRLRSQHAAHLLALTEEAEPHVRDESVSGGGPWLDRLQSEHDNIRSALGHFERIEDRDALLRAAASLWRFWEMKDHYVEGGRILDVALRSEERGPARASALNGKATFAVERGEPSDARQIAREALEIYREAGDAWGAAESTFLLGMAAADEGDLGRARELFEESRDGFAALSDELYTVLVTRFLAWTYHDLGDVPAARRLHQANLRRARELGIQQIQATTLGALASYALEEGDPDEAISLVTESLVIFRSLDSHLGIATELCRLARALAMKGQSLRAVELISCAVGIHEDLGIAVRPYLEEENDVALGIVRGALDEAEINEAWRRGREMSIEAALAWALGGA